MPLKPQTWDMSHAWGKVMLVDLPSGLAWQLGIDENQQYMEVGLDVRIITYNNHLEIHIIWRSVDAKIYLVSHSTCFVQSSFITMFFEICADVTKKDRQRWTYLEGNAENGNAKVPCSMILLLDIFRLPWKVPRIPYFSRAFEQFQPRASSSPNCESCFPGVQA